MISMHSIFLGTLKRDLKLAFRRRSELANPLVFFLVVITLFPFAFGANAELIKQLSAGMIWIAALLSSTLSLDSMFRSDYEDGSLDELILASTPLTVLVLAKITSHWLITGIPLVLISVFAGLTIALSAASILALCVTLLIGTPVLSLLGAITVGLTVGLRNAGMLLSLILLPLYMPVLIFSVIAVDNARAGLTYSAEIYFLSGILVLALTLCPLATAAAIRVRMS